MGQKLSAVGIVVLLVFSVAGVAVGAGTFTDDDGNIHEANIEYIAAEGVTKGCNPPANTLYCPSELVSRGQMAAFLRRALNLPSTNQDFFSDDDGSTFENDINAIAQAGITKGCNPPANTSYCPDGTVTRGQMAAFLVRGFGYTNNGGGDLFIDDDNSVFENDIDKLGTAGVTKGCNPPANDRYCPNDFVRRDAMASFLARALKADGSGQLGASRQAVDFGAVLVGGEESEAVTLTNLGSSGDPAITITAANFSGADAGEFSHNLSLPRVLNPGGSVVVTITHDAGASGLKSATLSFTHSGSNSPLAVSLAATDILGVAYRVNAGGPAVPDSPQNWESDNPASPYLILGGGSTTATATPISLSDPSVPGGTPMALFQTERWDPAGGSEMQWGFPVADGVYQVNLYFAETFADIDTPGERVFDVSMEGVTVLNDVDVFAEVGSNAGYVTSNNVVVDDGQLDLLFVHQVENPAVKAIEILSLGAQPGVLGVAPSSIDFGEVVANGSNETAQVVLTNLGQGGDPSITVTGVSLNGSGDFSHNLSTPTVVGPGDSEIVTVTLDPTAAGSKSATLSFTHSGSNSPTNVALSATIVDAGAQDASALVSVTPGGGINASTFGAGSIVVQNTSAGGVEIEQVVMDLSGSVVSDALFDQNDGTFAGDNVGKGFVEDEPGATNTGLVGGVLGAPRDNGHETLTITFNDFDPGEQFSFSVDIDPTSIQGVGAPGPNESGSISGTELSGATVTIDFSDGSSLEGNLFGTSGFGTGEVYLKSPAPAAPTIAFVGETSPADVNNPNITVRVSGLDGQEVTLLRMEYGLFLTGVPGGGYDIGAREANSAVDVQRYTGTIGDSGVGFVDIPVVLTNSDPDAGLNRFIATVIDSEGDNTNTSNVLIADYTP